MFGSSSLLGRRPCQQDALCVGEKVTKDARVFGIFDGHGGLGGGRCSRLAATKLKTFITKNLDTYHCSDMADLRKVEEAIVQAFVDFDNHLVKLPHVDKEIVEPKKSRLARWFYGAPLATFEEGGSCACVVIETPDHFIVANLGDSRAILSDGKRVSSDHTASSMSEVKRVFEAGAWTLKGRLYGVLVPTRTFGDFKYKVQGKNGQTAMSNKPEVHIVPRTPDMPNYLIIMCDGVHDALKDAEIGKLAESNSHLTPDEIADRITAEAFNRGSKDNISCIVIRTRPSSSISKSGSLSSVEGDSDSSSLSEN